MPYYRLYHLNRAERIERFDEFLAPHDEAAKAMSLERLGGQAIELWQQARKVTRFNPAPAQLHVLRESGRTSP